MRLNPLPPSEYSERVKRLQAEMKRQGIDAFESTSRYGQ